MSRNCLVTMLLRGSATPSLLRWARPERQEVLIAPQTMRTKLIVYLGTFKLIDNAGNPTFDPNSTTYNAPDGTFQIASDPGAFQPDQNFICGLGSVDGNGQRIPVATVRLMIHIDRLEMTHADYVWKHSSPHSPIPLLPSNRSLRFTLPSSLLRRELSSMSTFFLTRQL